MNEINSTEAMFIQTKLKRIEVKVDILAKEMERLVENLTRMTNVITLGMAKKPEKEN